MAYRKVEEYDPEVTRELSAHVKAILELLGEDTSREGLLKTPERVAKSWQFLTQGYFQDGEEIVRSAVFEEPYNHMVIVRDIELFSLCEHHMLPFYGRVAIAYIPDGEVVGLSKLARLVEVYARRLQVQERLTSEIADALMEELKPKGAMVYIEAEHMCMTMRGIKKPGAVTTTFVSRGEFIDNDELKNAFFRVVTS